MDDTNVQYSNDCCHRQQAFRWCLSKELPKSLKMKAAAAEQAVLWARGTACSSDPCSRAKSSGYEMLEVAKILEDAIFCLFVYLITTKVRKGLLWEASMRFLPKT